VTLWSGRVEGTLAPEVREFLRGDDAELLPYDCRASIVHAGRLRDAGRIGRRTGSDRRELDWPRGIAAIAPVRDIGVLFSRPGSAGRE